MANKTENTYYICYAWCEYEERMVDFFGSHSRKECEEECQCLTLGTRHKIVRIDDYFNMSNVPALGRVIAESKGNKPKPSNGADILAWQQFTKHEGDKHLFYVLAKFNEDQFVVWTFNEQDGGCYYGKYFSDDQHEDRDHVLDAVRCFEKYAEPHRQWAMLSKQEKFERSNEDVSVQDIPENYSHPSHLSHSLGEYEKEVK
tara:strand:- start:17 stop:619 length:603 start_codon:yes stop_codon:yes gene_type:complete